MRLVIDTNIILSALIQDGTTRTILLFPSLKLYTPEITFEEIEKHFTQITAKSGLKETEVRKILSVVRKRISIVPELRWVTFIPQAKQLIGKRDLKDVPFLAVALALELDGIWSQDKDFEAQNSIKVWKTTDLVKIFLSS